MAGSLVSTAIDGAVLIIKLTSASNRNSLTMEMRERIGAAVRLAEVQSSIRSVFLTAEGSSFCSGGDLKTIRDDRSPWQVNRRLHDFRHWLCPLSTLEKPVVVGLNGHAVGGGIGLALAGDVVIAAESAKFVAGFFRLGALPDVGVMYHLPRLIGMANTKNFLFGNGVLSAHEAARLGLVRDVVPDADLQALGLAEAQRLAAGPAEVMGLAKALIAKSFESDFSGMLLYERLGQAVAMSGEEFNEGLEALLEKRTPQFTKLAR